ncbi:Phosphodiest-domain-containing protein [Periconia macrospinosa]|uniref:Phosphodiest-domain-containing protein n=1 Tax=Periconia macrospinosa TaxID=97972 RepID=A0A2V1DZJ0_9PLEO|nr:Phosphodiest-domain-containing protein [Periconia macrospinosa]
MSTMRRETIPRAPAPESPTSADEQTLYEPSSDESDEYGTEEDDHDLLESEDERERLLTGSKGKGKAVAGLFNRKDGKETGTYSDEQKTKAKRRRNRAKRRGQSSEESTLMYEMEEGISLSSDSLVSSSDGDEKRLEGMNIQSKTQKRRVWRRVLIYLSVIGLFLILLFAAYRVSKSRHTASAATLVSNGTSLFAPTTILISLDGFRADFLYRGLTPTLNKFIEEGISPKYMLPSFPSVTFPNHYTMATGLYPEAHGVVGNTFWDPDIQKEFYYTDPTRSLQASWWGGEPLWQTAERQNVRVAVHMWPGSEVHNPDIQPAYVDKYNGSEVLSRKVERIMSWLDLPGPEDMGFNMDQPRPQLIAAYVPNVDGDGHKYGPNSTEIRQTIKDADTMLGGILEGLQMRNLTDIVNVVVVSDHGMATTDTSRLIQLEDLVDPTEIEHIDGWPHYGLRPKKASDVERLHKQIIDKTQNMTNVEVYLRDKDMPERYHFSQNERIAPLWIIPKAGWAIVDKSSGNVEEMKKKGEVYHPRGVHGYDHEHPLMRAIFVARGPAFPHKPNSRVEPFQNIHLYNIICDSISVSPAPNNGTLRLPLKPVGLHTDSNTPANETPSDPPLSSSTPLPSPSASTSASPTQSTPAAATQSGEAHHMSWWQALAHKAQHMEEWVDQFLKTHMPGAKGKDKGEAEGEENGKEESG